MRTTNRAAVLVLAVAVIMAGGVNSFFAQSPAASPGAGQNRPAAVAGRVLVKFLPQVTAEEVRRHLAQVGAAEIGMIAGPDIRILSVSANAEEAVARALAARPDVEFAEPDQLVEPDRIPNDPNFPSQWHLTRISGPTAWDSTIGSSAVTIAILDTGVDDTHPDLASKLVPGWNVYNNNSDTRDVHGHGTAVAGAAAAAADNFAGVASVAWNCRIMPIRISDASGYATYSAVASAMTWAADHGARVANLSYMMTNSSTVKSAAQYFQQNGGVVTMSAGNSSTFDSTADNPYVLTVSATNASDVLASWSNKGNNVDLSAPGESILTTNRGGGYGWWAGTSFSAPITAGIAALVKSANPGLSGSQVQNILKNSADDLGASGWDSSYGEGRVNAAAAVALALNGGGGGSSDTTPPTISITYPAANSTISGIVTVQVSASDASGIAAVNLVSPQPGTDSTAPYSFSLNTTVLGNGLHTMMAIATDTAGNTASTSIVVSVFNVLDTEAPVPGFSSPADGSTVSGNITIGASATDNVGVSRMELWIDGKLKSTSNSGVLTTRWNTKGAAKGAHRLELRAFDAVGNRGTATITVYR